MTRANHKLTRYRWEVRAGRMCTNLRRLGVKGCQPDPSHHYCRPAFAESTPWEPGTQ